MGTIVNLTPQTFSFFNVVRGFLMGAADIVPGVSGGTVALILGIYPRLVTAISHVDSTALLYLRQRRIRALLQHLDIVFLLSIFGGIAFGIISLASLMHYLLEKQTQHTYAAFFGLILASALLVARLIGDWNKSLLAALTLGAIVAYAVVGLPLLQDPPSGNWYVFAAGMIAICAMILPGISGSFVLLILGKYTFITGLLRGFLKGDFSIATITTLTVFCVGCAVGLIGFTKLLRWLLATHERLTMAILCGFMLGSLRRIWPFRAPSTSEAAALADGGNSLFMEAVWPTQLNTDVIISLGACLLAFLFVLVLDRAANARASIPEGIEGVTG